VFRKVSRRILLVGKQRNGIMRVVNRNLAYPWKLTPSLVVQLTVSQRRGSLFPGLGRKGESADVRNRHWERSLGKGI
jgi:hypothetical protein